MPKVKVNYQRHPCSRSSQSIMIPCRQCIKCMFYNQEKKRLKIPKTPQGPTKNRTVIMSTSIDTIPEYKLDKKEKRNRKHNTKEIRQDNDIGKNDLHAMTIKYLNDPQVPESLELPLFYID